ncbi:MAG: hypothetical protein ACOVS5_05655, partial [Oligoflexus sp.]
MKKSLVCIALFLSASAFADAPEQDPVEIPAPVEKIFIPMGFDDNDNIEVVIHGNLPDTCHTVGKASAQVDPVTKEVRVKATSFKYPGKFCIQSITPFIQTISLGVLKEGDYQVYYDRDAAIRSKLNIARRKTESPDDFLYASVENAAIDVNFETGKQSLKLSGHFPYFFVGCMVLRDVRTVRAPDDVVVVQPIAEIIDTPECETQPADKAFEYTAGLKEPFYGEGLLHVRALNGTSINRFI